jgi:uncharacterized protein (DUF2236 family)
MYHPCMTLAQTPPEAPAQALPENGLPLGPDSLVWRWFADNRTLLLGPRAAVLQNMLPSLGQGVEEHSVWFAETLARLKRSIPPILRTVYGSDDDNAGTTVRDFHKDIKGTMPSGERYSALNPDTYYWAHATFVDQVITATDTFIKRLTDAEKEQVFRESITWFARYGVSATGTPRTYAEFQEYWDHALDERLVAHRTAAYGVGYVTKGWPRPKRVPAPVWFVVKRPINAVSAFLTTGGMPERAREILGLPWDERRERRYQRFAAVVRASAPVFDRLPATLRLHPIALRAYKREGREA